MRHTCVKDDRMEGHELQFWTCEYPVQTENIISNCEEGKGLNKNPKCLCLPSHNACIV